MKSLVLLVALVLFNFISYSTAIKFFIDDETLKVPTSTSSTYFTVNLLDIPEKVDITELNTSFNTFFKHISDPKIDPSIKTILLDLQSSYKYFLTLYQNENLTSKTAKARYKDLAIWIFPF